MITLPFTTVDVFTDTRFEGNQLAIVQLSEKLPTDNMQRIAKEFDYSETIFIHPKTEKNVYPVNIFTANEELPFAGHPTIGAADFVLGHVTAGSSSATLVTKAGPIPVEKSANGITKAEIPHNVHIHKSTVNDLPDLSGLSSNPTIAEEEKKAPIVSIVKGMSFALIRLPSLEAISDVKMSSVPLDMSSLLDPDWQEGIVGKYYYVVDDTDESEIRTRMIYLDIMEDPATGSAACTLASYLALSRKQNQKIHITQGVEIGRKSRIGVEVELESDKIKKVILSGKSVKVMEGKLIA